MSSTKEDLIRKLFDGLFNEKRIALIATLYAAQCEGYYPEGRLQGRDDFRAFFEQYTTAFPDCRMEINFTVSEGDRVVVHYTFVGTHTGRLLGLPPTGLKLTIPGVVITRFVGERIVEQHFVWDNLGPNREICQALTGQKPS